MKSKAMEKLAEACERALLQVGEKGDLTPTEADASLKVMCLLQKIWMYEHAEEIYMNGYNPEFDEEYSETGHMPDQMMDDEWSSGRRGRNSITGRYMSRRSGHSIPDRAITRLEKMMDEASSEYERQQIREMISDIRKKQYE